MNNIYIVWHGTLVCVLLGPWAYYYAGLIIWLEIFTFMFDIGSNGFIGDWCTMYRWGHNYNIISSVDHPGFKSDLATNDDVPQQYRGTGVEL